MTDTPETNEAQFGTGRVSVDFARRLERERDEARKEAAMWKARHDNNFDYLAKRMRELAFLNRVELKKEKQP